MDKNIFDVLIIGAGASGLTTALYTAREGLKTIVVEKGMYGGQMQKTNMIENYSGFRNVYGSDLSEYMYNQLEDYNVEFEFDEVVDIVKENDIFTVKLTDSIIFSKSVVIAVGVERRKLGVVGEEEFAGKGVAYCGICDGAFFTDKDVIVVGGGNSALEEADYLTKFAKKVTVVHRLPKFERQKVLIDKVLNNKKIKTIYNSRVTLIDGDDKSGVTNVTITTEDGLDENIKTDGVFISIGLEPKTNIFKKFSILDDYGYVLTDGDMSTSVEGLFAIGDVRYKQVRQIATAVGDGATAGVTIGRYLNK